jgi:predicted nucleic acid-binding protein
VKLLLDTSVWIDILRGKRGRRELIARHRLEGHSVAISVVSIAEIYAGLQPAQQAAAQPLFEAVEIIALDFATAKHGGQLRFQSARKGRALSLADALIAATALDHKLVLLTDNVKDFPMPELQIYPLPA